MPGPVVMAVIGGACVGLVMLGFIIAGVRRTAGSASLGAGGLNYVVGPMGSGKSMFGVRRIVEAVAAGHYCVTNIRLFDGWESMVCKREFPADFRNAGRRARREAWLRGHYVYAPALREAMRYRLPLPDADGRAVAIVDGKAIKRDVAKIEGRGVVVWDESHNDLNNRDYQGHGAEAGARNAEKERRRLVLRWATQLRKLGYVGYLLSQHQENTDAQLRRVCNHIIRLQNQRQQTFVGKVLPRRFGLFLARWFPAHLGDGATRAESVKLERYFMPWHRDLYDSWETFHGLDAELGEDDGPIALPSGGRHRAPADAGELLLAADTVAAASDVAA